jgi:hypothetical protein
MFCAKIPLSNIKVIIMSTWLLLFIILDNGRITDTDDILI